MLLDNEEPEFSYPLEMTPVLEAVVDYGRRMNALGAMLGAKSLQEFADKIRSMGPPSNMMLSLAKDADDRANNLMSFFMNNYDMS